MGMNCYFSSMNNTLFRALAICAVSIFGSMSVYADAAAEKVLRGARFAAALQNQDLNGHMKKDGRKTPVVLFLRGENIQFKYTVRGVDKRFHMRLKADRFDLLEIVGNKTRKFNTAKLSQNINNTDLSFEDLSMSFLYWKQNSIVGEEKVSGQKCYLVRLINPNTFGDYRIVYAWIHKKYGALMRVVGYDGGGNPLKKFQVTDLMKVGKEYTLRRMRVDSMVKGKVTGTTYLEFKKPKRAVGQGRGR